jgi:hypothetical protein
MCVNSAGREDEVGNLEVISDNNVLEVPDASMKLASTRAI